METFITLSCEWCKKPFKRKLAEHKRSLRGGSLEFCSGSCRTRHRNKHHPGKGNPEYLSPREQDEYSPFRYFMRKARNRRHETDLDLPYLKELWEQQKGCCALSGLPMSLPKTGRDWESLKGDPWKPSLDREDSSKGYIKGNVRFVTVIANFAKGGWADTTVIEFCRAVVAHQE